MGWKSRYNTIKIKPRPQEGTQGSSSTTSINNNKSWLPQFYQGSYDRIARYMQYDHMDYDVDINLALDTIAEFCTLNSEYDDMPFELQVSDEISSSDVIVLRELLKRWVRINEFSSRLFDIFRNVIKYGDQIMIRDPESFKLYWVDIYNVAKVLVNEEEGKEPEYYFIKNLSFNLTDLIATDDSKLLMNIPLAGGVRASRMTSSQSFTGFGNESYTNNYGSDNDVDREYPVASSHVVHITKSTGMDNLWPFGRSVLDSVFKPFKQKELLEDAIIIYRVQRSPERLMFKIDTGGMSPKRANEYVNTIADTFRQKRQPVVDYNKGETIMDTTYNPMSITEDFFFAQGPDGRGSSVEVLPGGECLALETEVRLIDGTTDTLKNLIKRYEDGEMLMTYTVDKVTGVVCPAMITWAGVTRQNADVIKLHFSDGESVICTPDHEFPVKGKGYVQAQDIEDGDEFFVLHERFEDNKLQYYVDRTQEWLSTEEMFNDFFDEFGKPYRFKDYYTDQLDREGDVIEYKTLERKESIGTMDTGTLTIDGAERFTDNHTFPIGNGIFTKNSTGSIEDLKFFTSRMIRGLRVPIAYMSYLTEDGQTYQYNDGKTGTAYMEEFKFSKYCERLQKQVIRTLNREFKLFVKNQEVDISSGDFDIKFVEPQSFSEYRQIELDTAQMAVFQSVADVPYMSKRFVMKRFMGLSDAEIKENENLWMEEKGFDVTLSKANASEGDINVPNEEDIDELEQEELTADEEQENSEDLDIDMDFGDEGGNEE